MTPRSTAGFSEDALVEQPAITLFKELGWETANVYHEVFGPPDDPRSTLGRESDQEVVLIRRLRAALEKLNPDLPPEARDQAVAQLAEDRSRLASVSANREIYGLLKEGVKVTVRDPDGGERTETAQVVDWRQPENNDFFLASQLWVSGDIYRRRCDLVGFVNGLPLVFIELKAAHRNLKSAFTGNLRDYRKSIPRLFWYNALLILSNGSASRIGSSTAGWEHCGEWKKISEEEEAGVVSLETMLRGTCRPDRLMDLVENFTLFEEAQGGLIKKIGMNHQVLGVNRALRAVEQIQENRGRLGVFWHTQGSGKSVSMIFFAQKILRTLPGNWTFVIVTDRQELDDQIYKAFAACGAVTEAQAQATSAEDLRRLLREDHRYVFTLIQKFRTEPGTVHPKISDRSDIIVITDEAHRSQYDTFALNMRTALPNASFIGFTGTPLMAGEEKTREVFGDYVSIYNFRDSMQDGATVPLYYENRIPELQLTNQNLNEELEALLEAAELDEAQEERLEREFAREYHLITRDDRLEKVAEDLVRHFVGRGFRGKAMVVSIDKATALRMYDKVRKHWIAHLAELRGQLAAAAVEERDELETRIAFMEKTDMAVVVSSSQNEAAEMQAKGLDILPHRRRMVAEDLETKFKDPDDPFRLVLVCAMWMTGFDVPSCSTIYLDKPMRNHTLMQTIARANRVFRDKVNGLIVDYVGVFRNLQKALAIYAAPAADGEADSPIQDKSVLVGHLRKAMDEALVFCAEKGADLPGILNASGFQRIGRMDDAVEALVGSDDSRKRFLYLTGVVTRLYRAILPDQAARELAPVCVLLNVVANKIRSLSEPPDISAVMGQVEQLLDRSIAVEGYVIRAAADVVGEAPRPVDLSQFDFERLRQRFEQGRKRTEAERLRSLLEEKVKLMVQQNRTRLDFLERLQRMIDEYNAGSLNIEQFFEELLKLAHGLSEEEKRSVSESLSEEELAIFDLLTRPEPTLSRKQEAEVKKVARSLLDTLKREKLVLDWRRYQQRRQAVRLCIEETLDQLPHDPYPKPLYEAKCDRVFQHVYDCYYGEGLSVYTAAQI